MWTLQDNLLTQLSEKAVEGGDLDGRVVSAYLNQCTAEAQEVTIARAIDLRHNPILISALANETSQMFTNAANCLNPLNFEGFKRWKSYFLLKAQFYMAYSFNFQE